MSKPIMFWGQVDGYRVIEFDDGYSELQQWQDGKIAILDVGKTHDIIGKNLGWLTAAPETGMRAYRRIDNA